MKEHPRNQGTSSLDMMLLFAMPAVIAGLCLILYYLGGSMYAAVPG